MVCPDFRGLEHEFKQLINYVTFDSNTIKIKVYPCSLPDPSQCASAAEIMALHMEYAYPFKLLKPSDFKNPIESVPLQNIIKADPRTTKVIMENIKRNKVFDDTYSLVPATLKEEYLTLQRSSLDFGMRDVSQLHCDRAEVEKGIRGRCQEYISFEYKATQEVIVTTRSYKKLTTMLGEFGGILKIITSAAFFIYGVYSMRKVKSLMTGIIFGAEDGKEKTLQNLVEGKKGSSQSITKVEKIKEKGEKNQQSKNGESYEELVSRFVSRRSNVDSLMEQLNLLELMSKVIFSEEEKTLVPLVLLKSEQEEIQKKRKEKKIEENLGVVQIEVEDSQLAKTGKQSPKSIIKKVKGLKAEEGLESRYKTAFENLLKKTPNSPFCRIVKEYMVSKLLATFSEDGALKEHEEGRRKRNVNPKPNHNFKNNRPQKIELFDNEDSERNQVEEEVESPQKQLVRKKKKSGTGFMRPTNSPLRIRARSGKRGTLNNRSRTSLNLKSSITPPEDQQKDQADC